MDIDYVINEFNRLIVSLVERKYLVDDIPDFIKALNLIKEDKIKKAARFLMSRDTIVRDEIPGDIYDWLESYLN